MFLSHEKHEGIVDKMIERLARKLLMKKNLRELILDPHPLRTMATKVIKKYKMGSYEERLRIGAVDHPHYGYCVYSAAALAKKLGYRRISVLEFGVAGGNGLVNLEYHMQEISELLAIDIDIYGFDTGEGLPELLGYRDLPYHYLTGEDRPVSLSVARHLATAVLGKSVLNYRELGRLLQEMAPDNPAARCGLETAFVDALLSD